MTDPPKKQISYLPTDGLSYDPTEATYWDEGALDKEIERVFEVCHGCRYERECEGPWREYPEHFGWGEFVAVE